MIEERAPGGIELTPLPGRYITAPSDTVDVSVRLHNLTGAVCSRAHWGELELGCFDTSTELATPTSTDTFAGGRAPSPSLAPSPRPAHILTLLLSVLMPAVLAFCVPPTSLRLVVAFSTREAALAPMHTPPTLPVARLYHAGLEAHGW